MSKLTVISVALAGLSGCFYFPTYYEPAPGYAYVPGPGPSMQVVPVPTAPPPLAAQPRAYVPAPTPTPPPLAAQPQPYPPVPQQRSIVAHETRLRDLQVKRDQAQKDLDDYLAARNRERVEAIQRAQATQRAQTLHRSQTLPPVHAPRAPQTYRSSTLQPRARRPLSSIGFTVGARSLDEPIDGTTGLGSIGVHLSHRLAGSSMMFDLAFSHAGFVEPEGASDRVFSSLEASMGVRFMGDQKERGASPYGGTAWYVGVGAMGLDIIDRYQDPYTEVVISEETDTSGGTYASVGLHFDGRSFGSGDFELRQIMDTEYMTYGTQRSSDGVEALVRLSLVF